MGAQCQSAKDVCIDMFSQETVNHYYHFTPKEKQVQSTTNEYIFYPNQNNQNSNKTQLNDKKPSPQFIDSYNAYNNFFHIITKVIKIQLAYRQYALKLKRKKNKTKNKTEMINDCKTTNDEIIDNDKLVKRSSSSFLSFPSDKYDDRNIDKIKGYFLLKKNHYTFIGTIFNKKKEGFGIIKWEDGSILKTCFRNSKVEGISHYIENINVSFMGYYMKNRPKGYGIFTKSNEISFEGEWDKNNQTGIGITKWNDSTVYKGEFVNSIKTGIGTLVWADGTQYQGEFDKNQMAGYGMIIHSDKRKYSGEVLNGEMNGLGQFEWPDGKKYIGHYVKDKKCGLGIFYWRTKPIDAYYGFWKCGKQNGPGMQIKNQIVKYGIWSEGRIIITLHSLTDLFSYMTLEQKNFKKMFYLKPTQLAMIFSELI